jgi:endonuclease III
MSDAALVSSVLDRLEAEHGCIQAVWPRDPYEFIVWWYCGYPASDDRCAKGWAALTNEAGIAPEKLLAQSSAKLAMLLKAGGMVPELRAQRLKEIAMRVNHQLGGDLRTALVGPLAKARKLLKSFPSIADPGADRILLFARVTAVAAVPSNCPHVLVRILRGQERENYGRNYSEAQSAIEAATPATFAARERAYLLLKQHGQQVCKRANPKCDVCSLSSQCAYFKGKRRGRPAARSVPSSRC